jgi:hypothetical protein
MGRYDKIIKESLSKLLIPLGKKIGMNWENAEIIKDKIQQTIEREPDFLGKIIEKDSKSKYIGYIEFQSYNEDDMPLRVLFNSVFIERLYNLEVRAVVFYFGEEPLTMPNFIKRDYLSYKFEVYDMRLFSAKSFLQSSVPEEILLAIFGNFEEYNASEIVEKIVLRLQEVVKSKIKFKKFIYQLRVYATLRKLQKVVNLKLENMPINYDIDFSEDIFYKKGEQKGLERKATSMVENCLLESDLSDKRIAILAEVTEDFVASVKKRLINEGKLKKFK